MRKKINTDPLRDVQQIPNSDICARCGALLSWEDGEICEKCKEEIENE